MPAETLCWLDTCRDVARVVLYASSDKLAGLPTRPRQPVVFCLTHGSQVYEVMRAWRKSAPTGAAGRTGPQTKRSAACPNWLVADLRNGRLPRTSPDPRGWPAASADATTKRWGKR